MCLKEKFDESPKEIKNISSIFTSVQIKIGNDILFDSKDPEDLEATVNRYYHNITF